MADDTELASGTWTEGAQALRIRKCRLEVVAGPDKGKTADFAQPTIVVGRAGADFELSDRRVSALHLELRLEEDGYRLRDLQSTNGTQVWGMRIVEAFVGPGTTIGVGESAIRFLPQHDSVELPLWNESRYSGLVGESAIMRGLFATIERFAKTDCTVLVTGETGSGKELVAEAIHEHSPRAGGPFVVLDCGAVPAQLFEDQLFGHEAGAYTDARQAAAGVFEQAHGGTLFLDEIGELPLELQPKLLRAVETHRIARIGSARTIDCDVRVVAATNRDLAAEINRKTFRSDLYFRIAVARIDVPPLRERIDDVDRLIDHFLAEVAPAAALPDGFREWSRRYRWPGNVRELRNAVERAVVTHELPAAGSTPDASLLEVDLSIPFKEAKRRLVDAFDQRYLTALLDAHGGNIASAARAAGIDRMSIYKMLQRVDVRRRS
jgi:DNA-binding NtrC family response regulator